MRRTGGLIGATMMFIAAYGTGCAGKSSSETGIRIGNETLKQFEAGVTTEAWLKAVLGEPTSEAEVEGVKNTKVMRYASGESASGLMSLFSGNSSKTTAVTYFIVSEGVVTRFWADRATEYTLLGKPVEQPEGEKEE